MGRFPQLPATKGSQKWIQKLVNEKPEFLDSEIKKNLGLPNHRDCMALSISWWRVCRISWSRFYTSSRRKIGKICFSGFLAWKRASMGCPRKELYGQVVLGGSKIAYRGTYFNFAGCRSKFKKQNTWKFKTNTAFLKIKRGNWLVFSLLSIYKQVGASLSFEVAESTASVLCVCVFCQRFWRERFQDYLWMGRCIKLAPLMLGY